MLTWTTNLGNNFRREKSASHNVQSSAAVVVLIHTPVGHAGMTTHTSNLDTAFTAPPELQPWITVVHEIPPINTQPLPFMP